MASGAREAVWQTLNGYHRIALTTETCRSHDHIVSQNLAPAARKGAEPVNALERDHA